VPRQILRRITANAAAIRTRLRFAHGTSPPNKLQISAKLAATNRPGKNNADRLKADREPGGRKLTATQPTNPISTIRMSKTAKLLATGS
jgi:hypothetical protein